ncbi:tetratricopeptide repeat protein [Alteromonas sp. ZYF713]|nr:tetratricopeptide repeat protein [Alteromonas sp. ZYF713]
MVAVSDHSTSDCDDCRDMEHEGDTVSVVNKMLKDLENREASQATPANYQPPAKKSSSVLRIAIILLLGAVAIGAVYFWPAATEGNLPQSPSVGPINQIVPDAMAARAIAPEEPEPQTTEPEEPRQITASPATKPQNTMGVMDGPVDINAQPKRIESSADDPQPSALERVAAYSAGNASVSEPSPTAAPEPDKAPAEPVIKPSAANPEEALKAQIRQALSQNDTPKAVQLLRTLIRQQPDNVAARKRLAALYFSAGRTTDAQQLLQQTVADMPADSSVRLMYARLLVQQNETKLAYYTLQDVNDYAQPSIELLGYRASLAQKLGLLDDALQDYAQLVVLDSQTAKWWLGQAVVADKQGYTALALSSYREALSLRQLEDAIEQFIRQRLTNLTGVSS